MDRDRSRAPRSSRFGHRPSSSRISGGDRGDRVMHDAVCDVCGKACQIPFVPKGEKPVLCSDCFSKQRGGSSNRSFGGDSPRYERNSESRSFSAQNPSNEQLKEMVTMLETKLNTVIKLLEVLTEKKTVRIKKKDGEVEQTIKLKEE